MHSEPPFQLRYSYIFHRVSTTPSPLRKMWIYYWRNYDSVIRKLKLPSQRKREKKRITCSALLFFVLSVEFMNTDYRLFPIWNFFAKLVRHTFSPPSLNISKYYRTFHTWYANLLLTRLIREANARKSCRLMNFNSFSCKMSELSANFYIVLRVDRKVDIRAVLNTFSIFRFPFFTSIPKNECMHAYEIVSHFYSVQRIT